MRTFNRVCIRDYTVRSQEGESFTVWRGTEYLTSAASDDGLVTVFSSYWVPVPVTVFSGEQVFTE